MHKVRQEVYPLDSWPT